MACIIQRIPIVVNVTAGIICIILPFTLLSKKENNKFACRTSSRNDKTAIHAMHLGNSDDCVNSTCFSLHYRAIIYACVLFSFLSTTFVLLFILSIADYSVYAHVYSTSLVDGIIVKRNGISRDNEIITGRVINYWSHYSQLTALGNCIKRK